MSKQTSKLGPNDRLVFVMVSLIGKPVYLRTKANTEFEGVFSSMDANGDGSFTLAHAHELPDDSNNRKSGPIHDEMIFKIADVSVVCAESVRVDGNTEYLDPQLKKATQNSNITKSDRPDLQQWNGGSDGVDLHDQKSQVPFDQFQVNANKFGVVSSYREDLYTTALPENISNDHLEKANKIASEIEKSNAQSRQKGIYRPDVDDDHIEGDDEEIKFSAVARTGAYQQPSRKESEHITKRRETDLYVLLKGYEGTKEFQKKFGVIKGPTPEQILMNQKIQQQRERERERELQLRREQQLLKEKELAASTGHVQPLTQDNLEKHERTFSGASKFSQNKNFILSQGSRHRGNHLSPYPTASHKEGNVENHRSKYQFTKTPLVTSQVPTVKSPVLAEMKSINALNLEPALPKLSDVERDQMWNQYKKKKITPPLVKKPPMPISVNDKPAKPSNIMMSAVQSAKQSNNDNQSVGQMMAQSRQNKNNPSFVFNANAVSFIPGGKDQPSSSGNQPDTLHIAFTPGGSLAGTLNEGDFTGKTKQQTNAPPPPPPNAQGTAGSTVSSTQQNTQNLPPPPPPPYASMVQQQAVAAAAFNQHQVMAFHQQRAAYIAHKVSQMDTRFCTLDVAKTRNFSTIPTPEEKKKEIVQEENKDNKQSFMVLSHLERFMNCVVHDIIQCDHFPKTFSWHWSAATGPSCFEIHGPTNTGVDGPVIPNQGIPGMPPGVPNMPMYPTGPPMAQQPYPMWPPNPQQQYAPMPTPNAYGQQYVYRGVPPTNQWNGWQPVYGGPSQWAAAMPQSGPGGSGYNTGPAPSHMIESTAKNFDEAVSGNTGS